MLTAIKKPTNTQNFKNYALQPNKIQFELVLTDPAQIRTCYFDCWLFLLKDIQLQKTNYNNQRQLLDTMASVKLICDTFKQFSFKSYILIKKVYFKRKFWLNRFWWNLTFKEAVLNVFSGKTNSPPLKMTWLSNQLLFDCLSLLICHSPRPCLQQNMDSPILSYLHAQMELKDWN